jgi:hypothetical protein
VHRPIDVQKSNRGTRALPKRASRVCFWERVKLERFEAAETAEALAGETAADTAQATAGETTQAATEAAQTATEAAESSTKAATQSAQTAAETAGETTAETAQTAAETAESSAKAATQSAQTAAETAQAAAKTTAPKSAHAAKTAAEATAKCTHTAANTTLKTTETPTTDAPKQEEAARTVRVQIIQRQNQRGRGHTNDQPIRHAWDRLCATEHLLSARARRREQRTYDDSENEEITNPRETCEREHDDTPR